MRIIEQTVFSITELSEKAIERAHADYLEGIHGENLHLSLFPETLDSLKAFASEFYLRLTNYQYGSGYRDYVNWEAKGEDRILNLQGVRLMAYLWNNHIDIVSPRAYLKSGSYPERKHFHRLIEKQSQRKDGSYWVVYASYLRRMEGQGLCPLTGVCFDDYILEPIHDFIKKPDSRTFKELIDDCFDNFCRMVNECVEHYASLEYFIEECDGCQWEFYENGKMI